MSPDLLNVQNFTPTGFWENKIYAKKISKFKSRQNDVFNQIYFNSTVFNIGLTTFLLFIELLPKKHTKFGPKSQSTTKHRIFKATNLCQSREFYTIAVGGVGDI